MRAAVETEPQGPSLGWLGFLDSVRETMLGGLVDCRRTGEACADTHSWRCHIKGDLMSPRGEDSTGASLQEKQKRTIFKNQEAHKMTQNARII